MCRILRPPVTISGQGSRRVQAADTTHWVEPEDPSCAGLLAELTMAGRENRDRDRCRTERRIRAALGPIRGYSVAEQANRPNEENEETQ
ncbi:hypothetical protein ABZZ47_31690 [Streptomyces sp. NPDC006465]|uniref:hypothetical protein n=1 Tax=Streptomyces sp. NPDC006465 TaxID=3157174 RepID=UPI0033BA96D1